MPEPIALSEALRERTRIVHGESESSSFIAELMAGERSRSDYAAMLAQYWFVYDALESVAAGFARDAVLAPLLVPELVRLPAIEADLRYLLGADWRAQLAPLPATERYVERILATRSWPGGFLAHHYTRYLGDLSGGQIIRTLLQRHYGFEAEGIGFYRFDIDKPKVFRDTYRSLLDAAPWDDAEKARIVDEAIVAFRCNTDLFEELARVTAA